MWSDWPRIVAARRLHQPGPAANQAAGPTNRSFAMKNLARKVQQFLAAEDGPTAVEYAVMLALIVIVCLAAIRSIGTNANTTFESIATELSAS
jgi:pilus assembly protein Flp/PilA